MKKTFTLQIPYEDIFEFETASNNFNHSLRMLQQSNSYFKENKFNIIMEADFANSIITYKGIPADLPDELLGKVVRLMFVE